MTATTPPPAVPLGETVLAVLRTRGPLTREGVASAVGVHPFIAHLALEQLSRAGAAVRAGSVPAPDPVWGRTCRATVWVAV